MIRFSRFSTVLSTLFLALFCSVILGLSLHGRAGNPTATELNSSFWKDNGPLELSPDRGRFALTYSLLEDHSFSFSSAIARFTMPDLAYANGKFVSLFAPTVSFIVMPGYLVGKIFGASQVGTFAVISIFAVFNFLLLRYISIKLGAHPSAATIASLLFLFATPAFPYAVTLYQHHISTFLILVCLATLLRFKGLLSLLIVWFCCALSISVDNPNLFFMLPIGIFALGRVIQFLPTQQDIQIKLRLGGVLTMAIMVVPLAFFMYFNKMSYGNPFQLAGTVANAQATDILKSLDPADTLSQKEQIKGTVQTSEKNALTFFNPRKLPLGFYEHFISEDRGMITYTPIMFVGFLGLIILGRKNPTYMRLLLAIIGMNVLLYAMWGDPYGGWAFGSRYLIPTYSILSILIAIVLTHMRRSKLFLLLVFMVAIYSIRVNTIGALTSNRNPPKVEILALEAMTHRQEFYTYERNIELLNGNQSKSFVFQETILSKYLTAWQYATLLIGLIIIPTVGCFILLQRDHRV